MSAQPGQKREVYELRRLAKTILQQELGSWRDLRLKMTNHVGRSSSIKISEHDLRRLRLSSEFHLTPRA